MKNFKFNLGKVLAICFVSFLAVSCAEDANNEPDNVVDSSRMEFLTKNFQTLEELGKTFPKEDIALVFTVGENGVQALYSLKGKTAEAVGFGIFVAKTSEDDTIGTDCSGTISCGNAIEDCLQKGKNGLISNAKCEQAMYDYCVTCQDPK